MARKITLWTLQKNYLDIAAPRKPKEKNGIAFSPGHKNELSKS